MSPLLAVLAIVSWVFGMIALLRIYRYLMRALDRRFKRQLHALESQLTTSPFVTQAREELDILDGTRPPRMPAPRPEPCPHTSGIDVIEVKSFSGPVCEYIVCSRCGQEVGVMKESQ